MVLSELEPSHPRHPGDDSTPGLDSNWERKDRQREASRSSLVSLEVSVPKYLVTRPPEQSKTLGMHWWRDSPEGNMPSLLRKPGFVALAVQLVREDKGAGRWYRRDAWWAEFAGDEADV